MRLRMLNYITISCVERLYFGRGKVASEARKECGSGGLTHGIVFRATPFRVLENASFFENHSKCGIIRFLSFDYLVRILLEVQDVIHI